MTDFLHCGTFSKEPRAYGIGTPEFVLKTYDRSPASACVRLSDGEYYLDTILGLGSYPRGYRDPTPKMWGAGGGTFALPYREWIYVKEMIRKFLGVEEVHPVRTGSDACLAAVTLARAIRPGKVLVFEGNYHGQWLQWKDPARGSLIDRSQIIEIDRHDSTTWGLEVGEISCVIAEFPVMDRRLEDAQDWGNLIRALQAEGVLFIADEVVTACRFPGNLVFSSPDLPDPDLICAGKGLANGFGMYVVGGSEELLGEIEPPNPVFVSSTYAADVSAIIGTMDHLLWASGVEPDLGSHLFELGYSIWDKLDVAFFQSGSPVRIIGQPSRWIFQGESEDLAVFRAACLERKVLVNRPFLTCAAHDIHIQTLAETLNEALEVVSSGDSSIPTPLPEPLFKER